MRVKYRHNSFSPFQEGDLDQVIRESLLRVAPYTTTGTLEDMQQRLEQVAESFGALIHLLVLKGVLSLEDVDLYIAGLDLKEVS